MVGHLLNWKTFTPRQLANQRGNPYLSCLFTKCESLSGETTNLKKRKKNELVFETREEDKTKVVAMKKKISAEECF